MGLRDEVKAQQAGAGPLGCVRKVLVEHPDLADELNDVLGDPTLTASAISRALKARGVQLSHGAINRHRKKQCGCELA